MFFFDEVCEFPSCHFILPVWSLKLEEEERAKIEEIKHKECEKAVAELDTWKVKHKSEEEEKAVQGQQHSIQRERTTQAGKAEKLYVDSSTGRVAIPHQGIQSN